MSFIRSLTPWLATSLLACGGGNGLGPGAGDGGSTPPDLSPALATMSLTIGPIPLAGGEEKTVCSRFKLKNAAALDVVKFAAELAPGSHHLIFYRAQDTTENLGPYNCSPLDISRGDQPLFIAETQNANNLPLPSGVSYHFQPGDMVRLEAHYINATPNPLVGMGKVDLTLGKPGTYQVADLMFCGSVSPLAQQIGGRGVPPGMSKLPPGFYAPPPGVKVFGLTTHEHKRGSLMTIDKATGTTGPATNLTMGQPYDNPPLRTWADGNLLTFNPGEGFRWQCFYDNHGATTYYFGQSAEDNEMCFFWAYYYPSVGHFISTTDCWQ